MYKAIDLKLNDYKSDFINFCYKCLLNINRPVVSYYTLDIQKINEDKKNEIIASLYKPEDIEQEYEDL
jgi:hypothetical protein